MSKNIYTIISECVANIRKVCTITSVTVLGTTYTFNTTNLNGIAVGLYVNFGTAKNYIVTEIKEYGYFKVVSDENLLTYRSAFIACDFKEGTENEIMKLVSEESQSNAFRYTIYPFFALLTNNIKTKQPGYITNDGIVLALFVPSSSTIKTETRITSTLIPTLQPYVELFKNELNKHKSIIETPISLKEKITQENIFSNQKLGDHCDAIQLSINNLNIILWVQ
jgi:hypothetical protein